MSTSATPNSIEPTGLSMGGYEVAVEETPAIKKLKKNSVLHDEVRDKLNEMLKASERRMSQFYPRWRTNERRLQAYIDLPKYEELLRQANEDGKPPSAHSIVIPYAYATQQTIVTYLLQTFVGAKPYFMVAPSTPENAPSAHLMEQVLQYNADHIRFVKRCKLWLDDAATYGVGAVRTAWRSEERMRTVRIFSPDGQSQSTRESQVVFEGTDVMNLDPFRFFPDPRVPMADVNRRGEFVFWRTFENRHMLKQAELDGYLFNVDSVTNKLPKNYGDHDYAGSERNLRWSGEAHPGENANELGLTKLDSLVQLDQGSVTIIPKQWKLGTSKDPEKWLFTIANRETIIQAEPLHCDHDLHPVAVIEPWGVGYGFGQAGLADYLGPYQDLLSWMQNFMIHNKRSVNNNRFFYDPWMVNEKDLMNSKAGGLIPLKQAAMGRDPKTVVAQFPVTDASKEFVPHMDMMRAQGDELSGATDALRGAPPPSRTPAQTTRIMAQAGASRLQVLAQTVSSQGMCDLTQMMVMNALQYMSDDFFLKIVGSDGMITPLTSMVGMPVGDFTYPTRDGSLPLDKQFMLEQWKEIFQIALADPEIRAMKDPNKMLDKLAEMSGIKDLERYRREPDQVVQQQAQAGNMVPANQMAGQAQAAVNNIQPQGGYQQ